MKQVFLLLLAVTLSAVVLFAQRTAATISGTVTDPSGALVPNAKVTATNTATGAPTSVNTNASGFYVTPDLQPGPYRLDVAVAGFQSYERTGIVLQVGEDLSVNVSLKIGSSTEKITVTALAPLVNTRDQTLATAITPQFTEQLPLNGRDILLLMAVAPDSSPTYSTYLQYASRPEAADALVTGSTESRGDSTTFMLDGGLNMDTYTPVANVFPNPDAVQEFTYQTNSTNAKYGGLGGGIVNAVTRGGTNQFHGSAFEYVRNGDVNARNFFAADQDTMKRNQFGGSVGFPIQKDKMFGFFSFQRTTFRYGTTANVAYGPTAAELAGDWTQDLVAGIQLYNNEPSATTYATNNSTFITGSTVPFPDNQVPTSLYAPIAYKILALVPKGDPITGKITYYAPTINNDPQYVARVDRNFGDKWRLSGSLLVDTYEAPLEQDPNNALTATAAANWPSKHGALNLAYSFGPTLFTTVGATFSRALINYTGTHAWPTTIQLGANFPNWLPTGEAETGGYFGWYGWGVDDHYDVSRNQYDFTNGWTYTRGNHMLEFGGEFILSQSILNQDFWGNGYTGSWCALSGDSALDFMLGQDCYYEQYGNLYDDARGKIPALYVNDNWKVKHRLTLNLGVRWAPWRFWPDNSAMQMGMVINPADYAAGIKSTKYPNLPAGFLVRGDPGVPNTLVPSDWKLLDPRIGFAWDVRGNGKTSIRAGVGLYQDQPFGEWYNQMLSSYPYVPATVITDPTVPWFSPYNSSPYNGVFPNSQEPQPSSTVFPLPLTYAIGFTPGFKPEGTAQWNLTVERQLGRGFLLRTAYEASESWHAPDDNDINQAIYIPGTNPDGTPKSTEANVSQRRPWYPQYGGPVMSNESTNTTSYNSMLISVEKRMTGNLSMVGGYRWAKCLDRMTSFVTVSAMEFTDARYKSLDRGLSSSDVASQIKMALVYRLPRFRSWGFAGRNLLGGWAISGIWNYRDGYPFSVDSNTDTAMDGYVMERADFVSGVNPHLPSNRPLSAKLDEWFNAAAFQNAATGTFGNTPRNFLRGPGFFNLDSSLIKSFPIHHGPFKETQKIDFRAEAFNVFNHPNFQLGNAASWVFNPLYPQITSAFSPRIMQFALKYIF
jgi:hypothetical protein